MGTFDERLRKVMERKGITATEVARRAEMPKSTLNRLLNRTRQPNLGTLRRLAKALETSLDYLAGEDVDDTKRAQMVADVVIREVQTRYGIAPSKLRQQRETPVAGYVPGPLGADFSPGGFPMGEPVATIFSRVDYPETWVAVVKGHGYAPRLLDSWRLFCSPKARWRDGDVVLMRLKQGDLMAGTIHEHKETYTIGALNPSQGPSHFDKAEVDFVQRIVAVEIPPHDEDTDDGETAGGDV